MTSRPLDGLLTAVFDKLSHQMAGGRRQDPSELLPGADDPFEGLVPDDFAPEFGFDWFDPTVDPNDFDTASIAAATGPGRDGKGQDFFRGGEAPDNYTNRNNPLYQARRDFAVNVVGGIEDMFGVSANGSAGYMRPFNAGDAAPGGRSGNSDHYSGGAIDFFGEKEELDSLRAWLVEQPFTSFVRWQSESHFDHLHVSFDIGWIAQNFYKGRQVPTMSKAKAPSGKTMTAARERETLTVPTVDDSRMGPR